MLPSVAAATAALLALCAQLAAAGVTPAQQVVNMLTEMNAKGNLMKEQEKKTFQTYYEWADDRIKDAGLRIQSATAKIDELVAFATKADSDVASLSRDVAALEAEIGKLEGARKSATGDRSTAHAEYLEVSADYAESIDALERAIQTLKAQNYDRDQADVLLQRLVKTVPGMTRAYSAFLQETRKGSLRGDGGAPAVAAYEFQSGGVLDVLKKLHDKFKGELADIEEDEANGAHAHSMADLHLGNTIKQESSDRDEKAVVKGQRAAASAKAKGELTETRASKAADEELKAETEATLRVKASTFEENQKVRDDEMAAISKAIEILSSPEVQDSYATHISSLVQRRPRPTALLQLRRVRRRSSVREQASSMLRRRAATLRSKTLASLADQVAANPFEKVIGMIEGLLAKLKEEAASEADHKQWCDDELKANKLKRNEKTAKANQLTAEVESFQASVDEMASSIKTLLKEQADLTTAMTEATDLRTKEKADNLAAIQDATGGAEAVKKALVVLKEFYAAQGASFLQQEQVPEMAAYKGMQDGKGGVLGMLEVIESDFSRLKADTEASETAASMAYDQFMKESEASKKQKHEAEFKLSLDKDQAEFEQSQTEKDLASTRKALSLANQYYEELKPSCIEVHVSFEEREAARKEEIEALKEAYKILDQKSTEA